MPLQAAASGPSVAWQMTAVVWALAIGGWDVFRRRIPNALTFAAALAAAASLAFRGASPLGADSASVLAGGGAALLFTLPGYLMRKLGAGDVKLLLAVALLGGLAATLISFVVGALITGAVAVAWILLGYRFGLSAPTGKQLPFGAALALGFVVAVVSGQVGGLPWPR